MKLFEEYPWLEDETVILHRMTTEDVPALKEFTENGRVYETLPSFLYELKYEDKQELIAKMDEECFLTKESLLLGVYGKEATGSLLGIAEVYNYEPKKEKASIGYRLDPSVWGRGIGSRVTALLKAYLLEEADLKTITAHVLHDNRASARVLQKNGFLLKYPGLWEDWGFPDLLLTDKYVYKRDADKLPPVHVEAMELIYRAETEMLRKGVPDGCTIDAPFLRLRSEIRDEQRVLVEFDVSAAYGGRRGWLNLGSWKSPADPVSFERKDPMVTIRSPLLTLSCTGTGETAAPTEREGTFYFGNDTEFRPVEKHDGVKEACGCSLEWHFPDDGSLAAKAAALPCKEIIMAWREGFVRYGEGG